MSASRPPPASSVLSEEMYELLFSDSDSEMATTATAPPLSDRVYVHQLNLTSADLLRRQKEKEMVEEEARKVKEMKEIRRRQREEEKRRDMEMLLSYNPWGKPGAGAQQSDDPKRKRYPEGRGDTLGPELDEELTAEGFMRGFGRPGNGAPVRTDSGHVRTQLKGDAAIRFQNTQDVRLSIENQLRYHNREDKEAYKENLDELIQFKQKLKQSEKEWENKKLMEMLEQYPFGKEQSNGGSHYLTHTERKPDETDPMFMATKPKRIVVRDEDFDPWGKGFGNPAWDNQGNVQRHKSIPSVDIGVPDPMAALDGHGLGFRRYGGGGAGHFTESGQRKTRLKNTLRNVKSMGPHIDDSYDPWGRPGGGAPFVREDGRQFEEKLGWSMTGHPKKRTRDAKNEYRNELQQEMQEQYEKKQKERVESLEPIVRIRPPQRMNKGESMSDVASIIRRGAGGRPKKDPLTGELLPNPRLLTDVTQEKLDIRRAKSHETLSYHEELSEQARIRREADQRQKQMERAQSEVHLVTWDSLWGRPGHGAPRDPENHKKENIDQLLQARSGDPYVKNYVTEVVPSKHVNRYDVPTKDALVVKRDYEFRTPFAATEV